MKEKKDTTLSTKCLLFKTFILASAFVKRSSTHGEEIFLKFVLTMISFAEWTDFFTRAVDSFPLEDESFVVILLNSSFRPTKKTCIKISQYSMVVGCDFKYAIYHKLLLASQLIFSFRGIVNLD